MEEVIVRELAGGDFDQVRKVDELTQKQYLGDAWERLDEQQQEEHLVSRRSEFLVNVGTGLGFVAEVDGEVVGFVLAHETLPFRGTAYIRHVAIVPECQGQGIGGRLMTAVVEKAKNLGMNRVWSMINTDNPKSMRMHEKLGFELVDRKEAVYEIDGV